MRWRICDKKIVLSIIASVLCLGLLNGCGHENEISIKIETYLQEEYGEEFEVLSWNQPKLLPSDNGAIYATCISKNDPKHPFEGSYFNPEEPNSEIEIIYDGYGQRLLAKQMESMNRSHFAGRLRTIIFKVILLYLKNGKTSQGWKFHNGKIMLIYVIKVIQIIKL